MIHRHGVQVRVIGDLSLLPGSVQAAAARCMTATEQHSGGVLNICFSYTCVFSVFRGTDRCSVPPYTVSAQLCRWPDFVMLIEDHFCRGTDDMAQALTSLRKGLRCGTLGGQVVGKDSFVQSLRTQVWYDVQCRRVQQLHCTA